MKIVKFRAWGIDAEMMHSWETLQKIDRWWDHGALALMQSTELVDKNGVEIYEGDIVRSTETNEVLKIGDMTPLSRHLDYLAENIGYFDGKKYHSRSTGGQYHLDDWVSWSEMYIVIGNLYENPEFSPTNTNDRE